MNSLGLLALSSNVEALLENCEKPLGREEVVGPGVGGNWQPERKGGWLHWKEMKRVKSHDKYLQKGRAEMKG